MTTDDELRKLIALGEKATARPWAFTDNPGYIFADNEPEPILSTFYYTGEDFGNKENNAAYLTAGANLAPEIAAELIAAREEIQRLRRSLESIANLGLQVLPVDKRWGTAFAFAKDALKGGDL